MNGHLQSCWIALLLAALPPAAIRAQEAPSAAQATAALVKAVTFFHSKVALEGGYVYLYSSDLKFRQGEGLAYDRRIWIQPPGTPAVGLACLDAYEATGEKVCLAAARDAALALVKGQLYSGGWYYSVTFDPQKRLESHYRLPPSRGAPKNISDPAEPGGWVSWRQRRYKENITSLDDNTTQAALRLLARVDKALQFGDPAIHAAAEYGLVSLYRAQYPIGAWSHNYDQYPERQPDAGYYPVKAATFPAEWSRTWTKDFNGCYYVNDRVTMNAIRTMLDAYDAYDRRPFFDAALRAGEFLLKAQMPEPQPAWCQQYDRAMQPVWDRAFEPPAVTAFESQDVMETLLTLYERTGDGRYLTAVARALDYLRRSQLPDGKLARFYELKTNRPLYFTKDYKLTYDLDDVPSHYQFVVNSRLEAIARDYRRLAHGGASAKALPPTREELAPRVRHAIESMDARGAWTEPGVVRDPEGRKVEPPEGIISSQTFIDRLDALSRYVAVSKGG